MASKTISIETDAYERRRASAQITLVMPLLDTSFLIEFQDELASNRASLLRVPRLDYLTF